MLVRDGTAAVVEVDFSEVDSVEELSLLAGKAVVEGMTDEMLQARLVSAIKFKQVHINKLVLLSGSIKFIVKRFLDLGDRVIVVIAAEQKYFKRVTKSLFRVNTSRKLTPHQLSGDAPYRLL